LGIKREENTSQRILEIRLPMIDFSQIKPQNPLIIANNGVETRIGISGGSN
jgi:hypothetical protein